MFQSEIEQACRISIGERPVSVPAEAAPERLALGHRVGASIRHAGAAPTKADSAASQDEEDERNECKPKS